MKTLKNRNFTLMIIGQIISLFGNSILRFSISLYVLQKTGSASIFAMILSISILPTILISPIGGCIADRVSRKHIMVVLDFLTSILILVFSLRAITQHVDILTIAIVMILLSIIQACYQPAVQSSVPLLVNDTQLMEANGMVVQVNALSNLLGPIFGGVLFAIVSFPTLLLLSALCFFLSAFIECVMKIPFQKSERRKSMLITAVEDLKEGTHFITKKQPALFRLLIVLAFLNVVLSSLLTVGLPYISNITLGLPSIYYGWLDAGMGIGSILGSILLSLYFKKYDIKTSYRFLLYASLLLSVMGIALLFDRNVYATYGIILCASILAMSFATMFNILAQTFLQQNTPSQLLGKVSSFVTVIVMCAFPIGQLMYGWLFDALSNHLSFVMFAACICSLLISYKTKNALKCV